MIKTNVILIFFVSLTVFCKSQSFDKRYLCIKSEFHEFQGEIINKNINSETYVLEIKIKNEIHSLIILKDSKRALQFYNLSCIGDMIHCSILNTDQRVTLFKKNEGGIKVEIFFNDPTCSDTKKR
jgi:hypothetical protein